MKFKIKAIYEKEIDASSKKDVEELAFQIVSDNIGCMTVTAEEVFEKKCEHKNVDSYRCDKHGGWCGTCMDCGMYVHASDLNWVAHGVKIFRESKFHNELGL